MFVDLGTAITIRTTPPQRKGLDNRRQLISSEHDRKPPVWPWATGVTTSELRQFAVAASKIGVWILATLYTVTMALTREIAAPKHLFALADGVKRHIC